MASSGKKGKKTKGKTLALTDFLQETPGEVPTIPIRKSNINWADDVEDVDQYDSRPKPAFVLPTAPKASRGYDDNDDKIPQKPPFLAYLSNLPYDVNENEIADFFSNLKIANMRIPKEGEGQRLRGFGYVEFEDRDSLIGALSITDCTLKNRRIRIELSTNSDNDRRRGGRNDNNRERSDVWGSDWRAGPRADMGFNRDHDERGRGSSNTSGSWRDGDRPSFRDSDNRNFNRDSDRKFGDRDSDRRGFGRRTDEITRGNTDDLPADTRTRTKLVLAPRTKTETSEETEGQQSATPSASIFGSAKPVDTSAREREIESRLAKQSERPLETSKEVRRDAWGKRNEEESRGKGSPQRRRSFDHSPNRSDWRDSVDRRGSPTWKRFSTYRRNSPDRRRSPDNRRRSPDNRRRSPNSRRSPDDRRRSPDDRRRSPDNRRRSPDNRRRSPDNRRHSPGVRRRSPEDRRRSPEYRRSPSRRHSPNKKFSPGRIVSSTTRRYSSDRNYSSDRSSSPDYNRQTTPNRYSPDNRDGSEGRFSPNSRRSPEEKESPDRNSVSSQSKAADEREARHALKSDRSLQRNDSDKRKEGKLSRDNYNKDMPKLKEQETPNFVASNKFAYLEEDKSE